MNDDTPVVRALLNVFREYGDDCSVLFALKDRYVGEYYMSKEENAQRRRDVLAIAEWLVAGE